MGRRAIFVGLGIVGLALCVFGVWRVWFAAPVLRHPDWNLAQAFEGIVRDPRSAEAVFRKTDNPDGYIGQVLVLRLLTPDPAAHEAEITRLLGKIDTRPFLQAAGRKNGVYDGTVAGLVPYVINASFDGSGGYFGGVQLPHYKGHILRVIPIACSLIRKYPILIDATRPQFGSSKDSFVPRADCSAPRYQLPKSVDRYERDIAAYVAINNCGTIEYSYLVGRAVHETERMITPQHFLSAGPSDYTRSPLTNWSYLSVWNRAKYLKIRKEFVQARHDLARHYVSLLHLSPELARRAAYAALYKADPANTPAPDALVVDILDRAPIDVIRAQIGREKTMTGRSFALLSVTYPAALDLVLASGANPNGVNAFGKTPLMEAALYNEGKSIRILLAHHAAINAVSLAPGKIPGNGTGTYGGPGPSVCWSYYVISHGSRTALMYAAANAGLPVIQSLLAAGADKALKDSAGATAEDYLLGRGPVPKNPVLDAAQFKDAVALLRP